MESQIRQGLDLGTLPVLGCNPPTGLIDSQEALERVQQLVESAERTGVEHAVCYVDLDDFQRINERGGRVAGDWVLTEIGARLLRHVRRQDAVARMGSDEFAVLLENTPLLEAIRIGRAIRDDLGGWNFVCGDGECSLAASVGVVPILSDSSDAVEVLSAADRACHAAREGYPARLRVATSRVLPRHAVSS